jgi:hypothetical protein
MSNKFTAGLDRRTFLKHTGAGGVALALGGKAMSVMAGPFESGEFEKLIPADKKLSAAWLRSLTERGEAEWYSDAKPAGIRDGRARGSIGPVEKAGFIYLEAHTTRISTFHHKIELIPQDVLQIPD